MRGQHCQPSFPSPLESDISTNTAHQSLGKQDLFQLTSFESSLERREGSEDVTPVIFGEERSWERETREVKLRVEGLLNRLKDSSRLAESEENIPSSLLREHSSIKSSQVVCQVEGLAMEIERLSSCLRSKQLALDQVTAENSLLHRKLTRVTDLINRYEEQQISPETLEAVPTCQGCNLL